MIAVVGGVAVETALAVPRLPGVGETVVGGPAARRPGGQGLRQALAAARLAVGSTGGLGGVRVAILGRVGADPDGELARSALAEEDVDVAWLMGSVDVMTGQRITLHPDGESAGGQAAAVSPGANAELSAEDCAAAGALLRDAEVTLLQHGGAGDRFGAGARGALADPGAPGVPDEAAAAAARLAGGTVLLIPGPVGEVPADLLAMVDVLVPDRDGLAAVVGAAPEDLPDLHAVADAARSLRGPASVVVRLGPEGALVVEDGAVLLIPPPAAMPSATLAGTPTATPGTAAGAEAGAGAGAGAGAVDAGGRWGALAGDAFCAGLAVAVAEREPLHEAARFACAAGALVAHGGVRGLSALPTREEVERITSRGSA
ncbi:PfkB family carbohydrate kinase [Phaeacidiphilus oryzae]|uniref:PfkB family carbohydrate kinase n=1 Tax=Phaeacidiphilus oryzae TaxID=348818 RepID=UPI000563E28D|nr:PfkB family carbohydrate kinase [Phaeacidiphilus oryzae]